MPKKCKVLLSNEVVTVIEYGGVEIQLPPLEKSTDYIYIEKDGNKFNVVQKQKEIFVSDLKETQKDNKLEKKQKRNEKTVSDNQTEK